jgi:putative ABC transport system substrate-binding protein
MNNRRRLLIELSAVSFMPGAVFAQAKKPPVLIGWLDSGISSAVGEFLNSFKQGMTAAGWKEGGQFTIEERWAGGYIDRLASLAKELADKRPAIIVASPTTAVLAAAKAAPRLPIVQANGGDLVASGLASSLARPGGMVTGVTNIAFDTDVKLLELLISAVPKVQRVGFLVDPGQKGSEKRMQVQQRAIARYPVQAQFAEAAKPDELEQAIEKLAKGSAQALVVTGSAWFVSESQRLLGLTSTKRWPVVANIAVFANDGALISYGADRHALFRRAAYYVDRILKGAKPADLPIEQPTTFELVVNLKTAKALGLTMPPEIMVQATRVIQ